MKTICFDLGGTRIKAGLFIDDELVSKEIILTEHDKGLNVVIKKLKNIVDKFCKDNKLYAKEIDGLSISFPGIVDCETRKPILTIGNKFRDAIGIDFQKFFDIPVEIDNDARLYTLGEWKCGVGKGTQDFVSITIGTGIGGCAVIDNKVLRGKHNCSGVLAGHMTVDYTGDVCSCSNIGCGEVLASATGLENMLINYYRRGSYRLLETENTLKNVKDSKKFFAQYQETNDSMTEHIYNEYIKRIGTVVVNFINAYSPEKVAIGGGISNAKDYFIKDINRYVMDHIILPYKVSIERAQLGDFAAVYGGNLLIKKNKQTEG